MITPADMPTLDLPPALLTTLSDVLDDLIRARWDGTRSVFELDRLLEVLDLHFNIRMALARCAIRQLLPKYAEVWLIVETPTHLTFYPRTLNPTEATTLYVPLGATVPPSDEEFLELGNEYIEVLVDNERLIVRRSSGVRLLDIGLGTFGVVAGEDVLALLARLKPLFVAAKLDLAFEVTDG